MQQQNPNTIDPQALSEAIRDVTAAQGFLATGLLNRADWEHVLPLQGQHLDDWLAQGYQADMAWMVTHRSQREDPTTVFPEAQSVVCVLLNYHTPPADNPAPDAVKIAQYAKGTDYHRVVKHKLKVVLKTLQAQFPGLQGRAVTDSAPVLEKALAEAAGLGWKGKNALLIRPQVGSYFFIGELFLNAPLVSGFRGVDAPPFNYCGSCQRCITACPTGAIVSDGVVDANQCIAYWTIESKAETFPQPIVDNLQGWVFGCDICQTVCPWNQKYATPTTEPALLPRPWNEQPTASDLLALTPEDFQERYHHSPLARTGLERLKRNVAMV